MANIDLVARFEPEMLRARSKNEAYLILTLKNADQSRAFWCECDVSVKPPLSLAHDGELNVARARVGILKPGKSIDKKIRLFTRPNNFPDEYPLGITAYIYDEDGAIYERLEKKEAIACRE